MTKMVKIKQDVMSVIFKYTKIPKALFTRHGWWRQQGKRGNNKCKNGIKENYDVLSLLQHYEPRLFL